jgi:hypothetical protein
LNTLNVTNQEAAFIAGFRTLTEAQQGVLLRRATTAVSPTPAEMRQIAIAMRGMTRGQKIAYLAETFGAA